MYAINIKCYFIVYIEFEVVKLIIPTIFCSRSVQIISIEVELNNSCTTNNKRVLNVGL